MALRKNASLDSVIGYLEELRDSADESSKALLQARSSMSWGDPNRDVAEDKFSLHRVYYRKISEVLLHLDRINNR